MASPSKWAEGPWDLIELPSLTRDVNAHGAYFIATQMTFAHNCMIRGMNALYQQSPHVDGRDAADMLFLGHTWARWITNHLTIEEDVMFTEFEAIGGVPKGSLAHEQERHQSFTPGLEAFTVYCNSTKGEDYDAGKFRDLIDTFATPFVKHLHDEIPALLALEKCDEEASKELLKVLDKGEAVAAKQDPFTVPPMVLGLCDRTAEGGSKWPPLPMGVGYVVNYVLAWRHVGAWRFLPSDHWGRPRAAPFGAAKE